MNNNTFDYADNIMWMCKDLLELSKNLKDNGDIADYIGLCYNILNYVNMCSQYVILAQANFEAFKKVHVNEN